MVDRAVPRKLASNRSPKAPCGPLGVETRSRRASAVVWRLDDPASLARAAGLFQVSRPRGCGGREVDIVVTGAKRELMSAPSAVIKALRTAGRSVPIYRVGKGEE